MPIVCPWCEHGNPPIKNCADDTWYHIYSDADGSKRTADCTRLTAEGETER